MNKLDITTIILTYNEELHIKRCLENVTQVAKEVFIIDCYSKDKTVEIANSLDGLNDCNVTVLQHEWPATKYAGQFNWALENAPIKTEWVMRFDADEWMMPDLIEEIKQKLPAIKNDVTGIIMNRRHIFWGRWMKGGIYPVKMLRIWRRGKAICEQRLMDEHMQILDGRVIEFGHDFCDENLHDISWFCEKHIGYAIREAVDLLDIEFNLTGAAETDHNKILEKQAIAKRKKKHAYAKKPLFWRSFAYFIYRYFLRGGWRDCREGFVINLLPGWWYRTLVDAKVYEIKNACGEDKNRIIKYVQERYNIDINSVTHKTGGSNSCA